MELKREMLITLAKKDTDLYPSDKVKQEVIFNRYKGFVIPLEEAEWVGLKPWEAVTKLNKIEEQKALESTEPWKFKFAEETLEKIEKEEINIDSRIKELDSERDG